MTNREQVAEFQKLRDAMRAAAKEADSKTPPIPNPLLLKRFFDANSELLTPGIYRRFALQQMAGLFSMDRAEGRRETKAIIRDALRDMPDAAPAEIVVFLVATQGVAMDARLIRSVMADVDRTRRRMAKKTTSENEPDADEISKVMAYFGAKGGANSRANLSAAKRTDLAKRAAKARWGRSSRVPEHPVNSSQRNAGAIQAGDAGP